MAKAMKHGTRIISYSYTDYTDYKGYESYIHPEITISMAMICDACEEYKLYGYETALEKAKLLRAETSNTLYVDTAFSFDGTLTIKRQMVRKYTSDGKAYYPQPYACRINSCGLNVEYLGLATKIAKLCNGWSASPLQVVEALKKLKAVCNRYDKATDCFLITGHLNDDMFHMPINMREQAEAAA